MGNPLNEGGIIDTMVHFPVAETDADYGMMEKGLGQHGGDSSKSPVSYLFKDKPVLPQGADPVTHTIAEMDRFGIDRCVVELDIDDIAKDAARQHPDRFIPSITVDPNEGMGAVRKLQQAHEEYGIRAAAFYPSLIHPQVPIDDRRAYPVYAKCIELDLPLFISVGVPGPRVPMGCQRVELLDEVCFFFPELKIVMRHGAEPWTDLAVKLMLKWPNLYYSTSAFAPRRYPADIVRFLNSSRGSDKVLFAGYYAIGLTWDRIFGDLKGMELKDEVWPKFLRSNAEQVLGLAA